MAIIKNVRISAISRSAARLLAKDVSGKVIDNGSQAATRWEVLYDRVVSLPIDRAGTLDKMIHGITDCLTSHNGGRIPVVTRRARIAVQAFNMRHGTVAA